MTYNPEYESLFGDIPVLRATREPCPVCGHPTGDCAGTKPSNTASIEGTGVEAPPDFVYVKEDVIREVRFNKFAKGKVLLARGGTYITKARAKEIGLI